MVINIIIIFFDIFSEDEKEEDRYRGRSRMAEVQKRGAASFRTEAAQMDRLANPGGEIQDGRASTRGIHVGIRSVCQ